MNISPEETSFDIDEAITSAVRFHQSGRLEIARNIYKQVLEINPNHSDALHLLGFIAHQTGDNNTALDLIRKAVQKHPETPFYHNSLGLVLESGDKPDDAIACYQTALRLKPDMVEALNNLGVLLTKIGKPDKAIVYFKKAISIKPKAAVIYNNLGNALKDIGNLNGALHAYVHAVSNDPEYAEAHFDMGLALQKAGRFYEAIACHQKALELKPEYTAAYFHKGIAHHELDQLDEAIDCYKNVLRRDPLFMDAHDNMGKAYEDMGNLDKALSCHNKTLKIEPDNADAHFDRSLILLLKGDLEAGFREYEWRLLKSQWKNIYPHRYSQPRWEGAPFQEKRLLVHTEQGLGDNIQFIRYLPIVKNLGGEVVFETKEELFTLFQDFPGIDELVVLSSTEKCSVDFDYHVPLLSLPKILGTTLNTIPAEVPYVHATPEKIALWRERLVGTGFKVGLAWAGSPTNHDDKNRSCELHSFFPLLQIPGVRFFGLQKGEAAAHVNGLSNGTGIKNLGERLVDFSDTAGVMENLDLVITVDTATAHLAGAMGKPVWTLLPFAPDWRWLTNRSDTPWYPTMRLFRQPHRGAWEPLFQTVVQELNNLIQNRSEESGARNGL